MGNFKPGAETTDSVCHLITLTDPWQIPGVRMNGEPITFESPFEIHIFLSRHGTELLRIREEKQAFFTGKQNFSEHFIFAVILAELPGQNEPDEGMDFFEGQVVEIVIPAQVSMSTNDVTAELARAAPHIFGILPGIIGMKRSEFIARVQESADNAGSSAGTIKKAAFESAGALLKVAADGLKAVAKFLNDNSRMPMELWNPKARPKSFADLLKDIGSSFDATLDEAVAQLEDADLGLGTAATVTAAIPVLGDLVAKINAAWISVRDFVTTAVRTVRDILAGGGESIETILGYVCGLWDGIMDAVIGFLELAALAIKVLGAFISKSHNLGLIVDVVREAADEIFQALTRIDWLEFLIRFKEEIVPLIVELLKKKGNAFIDEATRSSAVAGYYFGYLVYTIAEFFFPPLQIAKISKALRTSRATFSSRFFAKVTA
ncbi:MAG: hypothetical protein ABL888_12910 [Pirellulaceae bacterium]